MLTYRRATHLGLGLAMAATLVLTGCGGDDDPSAPKSAEPTDITLSSVDDIPGAKIFDDQWKTYRTAEITELHPGAGGRTIDVNYKAGPDNCSGFAGYAVDVDGSTADVTVIMGENPTCKGDDTTRTTVLPLSEPLGDTTPQISAYSTKAIPIG